MVYQQRQQHTLILIISRAKQGLQDVMIKIVKSTSECKPQIVFQHFAYDAPVRNNGDRDCSDYHRSIFSCYVCTERSSQKPKTVDEGHSCLSPTDNIKVP